jgi:hypothetical protein
MGSRSDSRQRIVNNFVATYGTEALKLLIRDLSTNVSGATTARRMGVSRERVRQWKESFGDSVTYYQMHPEVRAALSE